MFFYFGNVVWYVINYKYVKVVWGIVKYFRKGFKEKNGNIFSLNDYFKNESIWIIFCFEKVIVIVWLIVVEGYYFL